MYIQILSLENVTGSAKLTKSIQLLPTHQVYSCQLNLPLIKHNGAISIDVNATNF